MSDQQPPTADQLWNELTLDGLHGPWSWSDLLDHLVTIICYRVIVKGIKPDGYEKYLDDLFGHMRRLIIFRLTGHDTVVERKE